MTGLTVDLTDRVVVVTGGSRGLGREMVHAFADAGADVVITSRKLDACERVAEEVTRRGRRALAVACHLGRWDEIDPLVERVYDAWGRIDVLVNNAGMSPRYDDLVEVDARYFDSVVNVNLRGPFRLGVLVADRMRRHGGGSIVNVSSSGVNQPDPLSLPYTAAKAGLNAVTAGLARAYAPEVRVNALLPGAFETDISVHWPPSYRRSIEESTLLGRVGQPSELVSAALYLASDASSYVTGSMFSVDGGLYRI